MAFKMQLKLYNYMYQVVLGFRKAGNSFGLDLLFT